MLQSVCFSLTHWGRVTHLCVSKLTSIVSDNGLPHGRRRTIILSNAGILLIGPLKKLQWHFNRNSHIFIEENTFENVVSEVSAILSRSQCVHLSKWAFSQAAYRLLFLWWFLRRSCFETQQDAPVPRIKIMRTGYFNKNVFIHVGVNM